MDEAATIAHGILGRMGVACSLKTRSLHLLATALVKHHRPLKLADLARLPELRHLSMTTVYRLMAKLAEGGVLRRLGGATRAFSYVILIPDRCQHYLTCTICGKICEIHTTDPMTRLRKEVMSSAPWREVRFELELFGKCPHCQKH